MHLGRKYKFREYLVWMRRETGYLFCWSLFVTSLFEFLHWHFLSIPAPLLAIVGTAVAFVLAFKNQQCHARINEALAIWGQINSGCIIWANKTACTVGKLDDAEAASQLKTLFYRQLAWLTVLRFDLREAKAWENTYEPGNAKYLAALPTPERQSNLNDELVNYIPEPELQTLLAHRGNKETLILNWQYQTIGDMRSKKLISDPVFVNLTNPLDEFTRLQNAAKRIKHYPYARNYYSIAIILVTAFVGIVPFALFPFAEDLGKSAGIEFWTGWLNVPFSVFVGWIFVTLEKVGENSSNPFEGGPNDVPISSIARQIEIEMRLLLGENTALEPITAQYNILF